MRSVSGAQWYNRNQGDGQFSVRSMVDSDSTAMMSVPCTSSAYSRIFGKHNLRSNLLPEFLRKGEHQSILTQENLSKFNLTLNNQSIKATGLSVADEQPKYTDLEIEIVNRLRELDPASKVNQKELEIIREAFLSIFDTRFAEDRKIFKIGHRSISSDRFVIFREGLGLSEDILNCYMSIIVQLNRNLLTYNKLQAKIMVADTQFSEALLLKGRAIIHPKVNILNYDLLMFPIYTRNWSLLLVNMNLNTISLFDPFSVEIDSEIYTKPINKFIHRAIRSQKLTTDHIPEYKYKHIECFKSSDVNSGIVICNIAESLSIGKHMCNDEEMVNTYRRKMLITMIRASFQ